MLSEVRRPGRNRHVQAWLDGAPEDELYLSVLTLGEVRSGVERLRVKDRAGAAAIEAWLHAMQEDFGDRILPITAAIAERWGRLNAVRTLPVVDGLLAATALTHRLTLVTRNPKDVAGTGADRLNPFVPRSAGPPIRRRQRQRTTGPTNNA